MSNKIISSPLCTIDDIRLKAGIVGNPDITDEQLEQRQTQADGLIWSHVSSRYNILLFTDDIFDGSMSHKMLQSISIELASAIVLLTYFGSQVLQEDNKAQNNYESQMSLLKDIRDGQLRLLDINFKEFGQLPLKPIRTMPEQIVSSFNDASIIPNCKTFRVDKTR